jgi:hypothetical protein
MILTDLLGSEVHDQKGQPAGHVIDVRFLLTGTGAGEPGQARLHGLIISPRTRSSFLGYERTNVNAPAPIARFLARRHRGSFLVLWPDIEAITGHRIKLRPGYTRYNPQLADNP